MQTTQAFAVICLQTNPWMSVLEILNKRSGIPKVYVTGVLHGWQNLYSWDHVMICPQILQVCLPVWPQLSWLTCVAYFPESVLCPVVPAATLSGCRFRAGAAAKVWLGPWREATVWATGGAQERDGQPSVPLRCSCLAGQEHGWACPGNSSGVRDAGSWHLLAPSLWAASCSWQALLSLIAVRCLGLPLPLFTCTTSPSAYFIAEEALLLNQGLKNSSQAVAGGGGAWHKWQNKQIFKENMVTTSPGKQKHVWTAGGVGQ